MTHYGITSEAVLVTSYLQGWSQLKKGGSGEAVVGMSTSGLPLREFCSSWSTTSYIFSPSAENEMTLPDSLPRGQSICHVLVFPGQREHLFKSFPPVWWGMLQSECRWAAPCITSLPGPAVAWLRFESSDLRYCWVTFHSLSRNHSARQLSKLDTWERPRRTPFPHHPPDPLTHAVYLVSNVFLCLYVCF